MWTNGVAAVTDSCECQFVLCKGSFKYPFRDRGEQTEQRSL